jgi:predicted nucleic acid-binding Zn ribbon protein
LWLSTNGHEGRVRLAFRTAPGHERRVRREPTALGEILRAALARLPESNELASFPIWADWAELVGPVIARHARPQRLRRGVLVVEVDGPEWLQELRYLQRDLRARLNERLGRATVRELLLVLARDGQRAR